MIKAILKQKQYQGKPDVRFLLTPIPTLPQYKELVIKVEKWIDQNCYEGDFAISLGPKIDELHHTIFYNPIITTLSSLVNDSYLTNSFNTEIVKKIEFLSSNISMTSQICNFLH